MNLNKLLIFLLMALILSCVQNKNTDQPLSSVGHRETLKLTIEQANHLGGLPLACIHIEYPNKLSQTLNDSLDLQPPKKLHPAFYGCFDWHSSVHGHWALVALLKEFPQVKDANLIKAKLLSSISKENILSEVDYFKKKQEKGFERTYGWAWLLKLALELHTWNDLVARQLEDNLTPLTNLIVGYYLDFLPKLNYPIRVGEHSNTAFGLAFAFDYAETFKHEPLKKLIKQRASDFYMNDQNCPISWEPSGYDFLSPCLEEAGLMRRVLSRNEFEIWFKSFMPQMANPSFSLATGKVADRTDGKLVHLDGLNFSRAWCLYGIANALQGYDHLRRIADDHIRYSLPSIVDDNYEGTHWLGTFAIYALQNSNLAENH